MKFITEHVITPFAYPHPFNLKFVAQYRFVLQVGEFLVRRDENQQIEPGLAESWTISKDRKTIRFKLRPNLYDADETRQSLCRLIKAGQTTHSNLAAQTDCDRIKALDKLNLEITTNGDAAAILSPLVMADAVIIPDSQWKKIAGYKDEMVDWTETKGPYIYDQGTLPLEEGSTLIFVPNKNHYLFSEKQLGWRIHKVRPAELETAEALDFLLKKAESFLTVRFWNNQKLFASGLPTSNFYQTKPNGIAFLLPNKHSKTFSKRQARRTLLKRLLNSQVSLFNPSLRADQIAQPGLSGRLDENEISRIISDLNSEPDYNFSSPITFSVPADETINKEWQKSIVQGSKLPIKFMTGPNVPSDPTWKAGDFDLLFNGVGMSDTDPISGATFLFSQAGLDADLPEGKILKILNNAKITYDKSEIRKAIKKAFTVALEEGLIIPIHYIVNRHYFSDSVDLNISDPFSESVHIGNIREK